MNRKEIHFVIEHDGSITSTIKGIKGANCRTLAAKFESLGSVTEQKYTNEYYESNHSHRVSLDISAAAGRERPVRSNTSFMSTKLL